MMRFYFVLVLIELFIVKCVCIFHSKTILCNETLDVPLTIEPTLSIQLCNLTLNLSLQPNEQFFSKNASIEKLFLTDGISQFSYVGHVIDEENSIASVITYPKLQIYIYLNGSYYYYLSLSATNKSVVLKFSQSELLQYYPLLVNDSLWTTLQYEEESYQKNSAILQDLHFIYDILTMKYESDSQQYRTMSYCSLGLNIDRFLLDKLFSSNVFWIYNHIEHFNFLLRTLTHNEYGGFQIKRLTSIDHAQINSNNSLEILHRISNDTSLALKDFCLNHYMFLSDDDMDTSSVVGYQSSTNAYDVGGVCSLPFYMNTNHSDEINLNIGLSMFERNHHDSLSTFFHGLLKTSYLFFRQMGLNLTLCSVNVTRRGFFQLTSSVSSSVQHCIDLVPNTLRTALKNRAHLCFTQLNFNSNNTSNQSMSDEETNKKRPTIENIMKDNNRRGEWFEGNIVGMILTFSLLIWIPVSCFVHFCIDEINKNSLLEKQQQSPHELEPLSQKTTTIPFTELNKQTQTD